MTRSRSNTNAPVPRAASAVPVLSIAQRTLLKKTSTTWADVPTGTRANTVLSLVKRGLLEHRYKQPRHWADWVTWGEIRLK